YMVNTVDQAAESIGVGGQHVEPYPDGPFASATSTRVTVGPQLDPLLERPDISELAITSDGERVAVTWGPEDTQAAIFDAVTGEQLGAASTSAGGGLTWAPNNRTLFYWGAEGDSGLLTVGEDEGSASGSSAYDGTVAAAFSPDGTGLAYTTGGTTRVAVFGSPTDNPALPAPPPPSADAPTPIGLIDGMVMGLLDDDNALVLRDDFESTGSYCGGDGPAQSLWQVPLDGSEPTLLAPDLEGPAVYYRSPADRLAYISGCDVFDTLSIEDLADDNNELLSIDVRDIPSTGGDVVGLTEVDWVNDSILLLTGIVDGGDQRAWRVEVDTGAVEELRGADGEPYADVVDVALGLEGELMVLGTDYFASGEEPAPLDGPAVGMLSMNGPVAYNRPGELWRLGLDEPYADIEAQRLFVSRDGNHVLAIEKGQTSLRLLEIELEGTFLQENRSWPVVDVDGGNGFFTTDSTRFVYTARVENARGGDADGFEVRMLDFRSTSDDTTPPPTTAVRPTETIATPSCTPQQPPALGSDDDTIPQPVFETQQAIVIAAATCDYNTLAALTGPDFFMGFGLPDDVDPLTEWAENEAAGRSLAELYINVLLDESGVRTLADGSELWQWPAVATYDAIEDIPADVLDRHLARSGQTQQEFEADWEIFGTYSGYVLSIETDGTWVGAAPAD
ncbi:MAG: hypothetical protein OES57_15400, partial [Acidimicrobiia bacterium]|nr:hypothetical protein [Acidimicrobiia bacterium]